MAAVSVTVDVAGVAGVWAHARKARVTSKA